MKRTLFYALTAGLVFSACQEKGEAVVEADGYSGATMKSKSNKAATTNSDWWPNQLNLNILRHNSAKSNPMGDEFNYIEES